MPTGRGTERRYGGRTASERRALRRERLLDAGLQQFGRLGYGATTIEGLCAAASLNARYFYEQFRNREDLLGAVYDRHAAGVLDYVRAALDLTERPEDRLETGLRAFVQATLADERAARVNYFEMVGVSPELEARRRAVRGAYADLVAREASTLPRVSSRTDEERRMIAVALVGATDGLVVDWLSSDRRTPESAIVDTLLAVFAPVVG